MSRTKDVKGQLDALKESIRNDDKQRGIDVGFEILAGVIVDIERIASSMEKISEHLEALAVTANVESNRAARERKRPKDCSTL